MSQATIAAWGKKRNALILAVPILAIFLILTGLVFAGVISLNTSCLGVSGARRSFTVTSNADGYNNSKSLVGIGVWPVMNVSRCDSVTIKVVNADIQAHGLAVAVLAVPGITVPAGQTLLLSFLADKTGQYRVYCTIICTVHNYMLNGLLNVV